MSKRRSFILAGLLLLVGAAYGGLLWLQGPLQERDFSAIADSPSRIGYCLATSLEANEKIVLAESTSRPPDQALFARVMSRALSGEVTPEKLAASRALLERDDLRARATRALTRVAEKCGYHDLRAMPEEPVEALTLRWLRNDTGYQAVLAQARSRPADAAVLFLEGLGRSAEATATAGAAPRAN